MKSTEDTASEPLATLETIADFSGILSQGEFPWGFVTRTGIVLRDEITQETWLDLTQQAIGMWEKLGQTHLSLSMKVADLLNFGEEKFGQEFSQAIDLTRKSLTQQSKTVENWQRVFKAVHPSRRREKLTYSHHEAVVKLDADEQDAMLQKAEDEGLTVKALKKAIAERPGASPQPPRSKAKVTSALDVTDENAVTAMLQILANHLAGLETWPEAWREHTHAIEKGYRKHFRNNGKAQA